MAIPDIHKSSPSLLARMLEVSADASNGWDTEDLRWMLQHQLSVPLRVDLDGFVLAGAEPVSAPPRRGKVDGGGVRVRPEWLGLTFGELFSHRHPPVELLELVKQFAKFSSGRGDGPLPRPIATVLYFAALAVAFTRCNRLLTTLPAAEVQGGIQWALAQPWLDARVREVLEAGRRALTP